jgi:hypothetical protein
MSDVVAKQTKEPVAEAAVLAAGRESDKLDLINGSCFTCCDMLSESWHWVMCAWASRSEAPEIGLVSMTSHSSPVFGRRAECYQIFVWSLGNIVFLVVM